VTSRPAHIFPFTAIVGQSTLKMALLLNAIDPLVGGVLIRGEKGTAKSTAVRALAAVLPEMDVVEECRFACDPAEPGSWCDECRDRREAGPLPRTSRRPSLVDLPVSATEDRLVGTIDIEHALKNGARRFDPGLLADANRSILYVDEVNLLDDHLVDTLLDAAAMGVNTVQREGISFVHPARFILVGTMNPEEGDVRPQLLDRFGLCVDVCGEGRPEDRVEILKRRRAFEEDATEFLRQWLDREDELTVKLKHARLRLTSVDLTDDLLLKIASLCADLDVDGHRADLVMARAAAAHAALGERTDVDPSDISAVAPLVLAHRIRRAPFEDETHSQRALEDALERTFGGVDGSSPDLEQADQQAAADGAGATAPWTEESTETLLLDQPDAQLEVAMDRTRRAMSGKRQETVAEDRRGRYVRARTATETADVDLALDATLRAAAPHQAHREGDMAVNLAPQDLRSKVRMRKVGASIVFCVDASGSMGAESRIEAAKSAIMELLVDAYQRRDRVGMVAFRGDRADVVLAPTASVELAQIKMRSLPTGGATPLAAGLERSLEVIGTERARNPDVVQWLVLVTDGRANVGLDGGLGSEDARVMASRLRGEDVHAVVIDTGSSTSSGARELARAAQAEYVRLTTLTGTDIATTVRERVHG
jgi:magnesium chelatase subunit D